jgi:Cdc6-like AAA superfamily ATPase
MTQHKHTDNVNWVPQGLSRHFNAPCFEAFRKNNVEVAATGTFEWFKCEQLFTSWTAKSSLLWIRGSPGQGKTVLSGVVLGYLEHKYTKNNPKDVSVIYFFCCQRREDLSTVSATLC